jgi:hypothetical protein
LIRTSTLEPEAVPGLSHSSVLSDAQVGRIGYKCRLGMFCLRVCPLIILGPELLEASTRTVVCFLNPVRKDGARVIRRRCAALPLNKFWWGGMARIIRRSYRLFIRAERSLHPEKPMGFNAVNKRRDLRDELVEALWGGPGGGFSIVEVSLPVKIRVE